MIHDTSIKVDVYPDEFIPLLKVLNKFMDNNNWEETLTEEEMSKMSSFIDDFKDLTLQYGE